MLHEQIQCPDEHTKYLPELILTSHTCSEENGSNAQERAIKTSFPSMRRPWVPACRRRCSVRLQFMSKTQMVSIVCRSEAAGTRPPRRQRRSTGCPRGPAAPSRLALQRVGRKPVPAARRRLFELQVPQLGASI
jgi:hypothetical protein